MSYSGGDQSITYYPYTNQPIYQNQGQRFTFLPNVAHQPNVRRFNQPRYIDDDYQYLAERYGPDVAYEIIANDINENRYQRSPRRPGRY